MSDRFLSQLRELVAASSDPVAIVQSAYMRFSKSTVSAHGIDYVSLERSIGPAHVEVMHLAAARFREVLPSVDPETFLRVAMKFSRESDLSTDLAVPVDPHLGKVPTLPSKGTGKIVIEALLNWIEKDPNSSVLDVRSLFKVAGQSGHIHRGEDGVTRLLLAGGSDAIETKIMPLIKSAHKAVSRIEATITKLENLTKNEKAPEAKRKLVAETELPKARDIKLDLDKRLLKLTTLATQVESLLVDANIGKTVEFFIPGDNMQDQLTRHIVETTGQFVIQHDAECLIFHAVTLDDILGGTALDKLKRHVEEMKLSRFGDVPAEGLVHWITVRIGEKVLVLRFKDKFAASQLGSKQADTHDRLVDQTCP